jgi:hypothetical protein
MAVGQRQRLILVSELLPGIISVPLPGHFAPEAGRSGHKAPWGTARPPTRAVGQNDRRHVHSGVRWGTALTRHRGARLPPPPLSHLRSEPGRFHLLPTWVRVGHGANKAQGTVGHGPPPSPTRAMSRIAPSPPPKRVSVGHGRPPCPLLPARAVNQNTFASGQSGLG